MTKFQRPTSIRRENRNLSGRFRGGKLCPVMATALLQSESCMLSQSVVYELDRIAGHLRTPITAELISVCVPVEAIDAIKDPEGAYSGMTEVIRDKLLSGAPLFGLENENEISKRLGVVPRSIAGEKKVNEISRLAHNAAVNYLRQRKYVKAVKVLASNMNVTPALISQTVLDRLNAVLDPEDRVNGMVQFQTGIITAPLVGTAELDGVYYQDANATAMALRNLDGTSAGSLSGNALVRRVGGVQAGSASRPSDPMPSVDLSSGTANLSGLNIGSVSLTDFYNAELMDDLVRQMNAMIEANPEYGFEMVQRWAYGLSVDVAKTPFVVHESTTTFNQAIMPATDGVGILADTQASDLQATLSFTVPVPSTELGSVIITFACVKPDETIASQPHPILSDVWGATNFLTAELARDPVAVTMRDLDADVGVDDEGTIAFYTGHNELKRAYVNYGFNRHLDLNTVANKTAIWQLEVPFSVTPETVIYPETLEHYPFQFQEAEVCTYTINSTQTVNTPLIFGPTPVEEMAIIETANLFEDQ